MADESRSPEVIALRKCVLLLAKNSDSKLFADLEAETASRGAFDAVRLQQRLEEEDDGSVYDTRGIITV